MSDECFTARVDALETRTIKQVACGQMHTLAVTDNGLVFAWGDNTKGQLGLGNMENNAQSHPRSVVFVQLLCIHFVYFVNYYQSKVLCGHMLTTIIDKSPRDT